MVIKTISISDEEEQFIKSQPNFKLSWFVQEKLEEYKKFIEKLKNEKTTN